MLLNLRVFRWRNHRRRLPVGNLLVDIPNVVCTVVPTVESSSSDLPSPVSPVSVSLSSASTCDPSWAVLSVVGSVVCERHGGYQTGVAIDPEVEEFAPRAPLLFPMDTLFPLPQGCWFGYRRRWGCRFDTSKVRLEGAPRPDYSGGKAPISIPQRCDWKFSEVPAAPPPHLHFNTSKVRLEEEIDVDGPLPLEFQYLKGAIGRTVTSSGRESPPLFQYLKGAIGRPLIG